MTAHQAQALQAYEQHMRAVGKGTGRYARGSAAWPARRCGRPGTRYPPGSCRWTWCLRRWRRCRDSFDVVIVDEASQASLEDLFLLWLAPRVIVVGDDKQCAPSQVRLGELEPIFAKLSSYLPELPGYLRDAFTPSRVCSTCSGPGSARWSHCASTSAACRRSSSTPPRSSTLTSRWCRCASSAADRLPPLRPVRVARARPRELRPGCATGSRPRPSSPRSRPASRTRPTRRTFGVVVLQGTGQVQLIAPEAARAHRAEGVGAPPAAGGYAARLPGRRARRRVRVAWWWPRSAPP